MSRDLPMPGFARDEHDLALTRLCPGPAPQQQLDFLFPPDERGQSSRMKSVKAARQGTRAQRRPGPHWPGDALEVLRPKVFKLEDLAEKPARSLRDDDRVRFGQRLQARRQVGRLADHGLLLGGARADEIADHDETGGDADANLQGNARGGLQLRRRLHKRKPGMHGALGVMLMGSRIAKISQHPVAHIFGDETASLRDEIGAAVVVCANDLTRVLGVESVISSLAS